MQNRDQAQPHCRMTRPPIQLEQTADTARDSMEFAQLRRIFLKRIAELEIEQARRKVDKFDYKIAS
jgi:hypothetical protein